MLSLSVLLILYHSDVARGMSKRKTFAWRGVPFPFTMNTLICFIRYNFLKYIAMLEKREKSLRSRDEEGHLSRCNGTRQKTSHDQNDRRLLFNLMRDHKKIKCLGTMSSHLWWSMIMGEKRTDTCMCDWVTMLYSRKLTEHCKPAIMEKNKNHYIKK